jgi:hypothetical protein
MEPFAISTLLELPFQFLPPFIAPFYLFFFLMYSPVWFILTCELIENGLKDYDTSLYFKNVSNKKLTKREFEKICNECIVNIMVLTFYFIYNLICILPLILYCIHQALTFYILSIVQ